MARGFGTTFGTSGTTDNIVGGTNITVGTTFSISLWVLRNGNGGAGFGQMFSIADTGATNYMSFYTNGATNLRFDRAWSLSTNGHASWSVALPGDTNWHNYVITYDGSSLLNNPIVYKDGTSVTVTAAVAAAGLLTAITRLPCVGNAGGNGGVAWNGQLAEVAFWNDTILTAQNAADLGAGQPALSILPSSMTFYAPLWGSGALDEGPNHQTLTVTGALTQADPAGAQKPFRKLASGGGYAGDYLQGLAA